VCIDRIINELDQHFCDNSEILESTTYFDPNNEDFLNVEKLKPLATHYGIDLDLFQSELRILPNTLKRYEAENKTKIKSVVAFVDLLRTYKMCFQETYKLGVIILTMSISSAACERTFSCMCRLKNYFRSTMSNERLSDLAVLYIEKKITKSIDLDDFINLFAQIHKNRRIVLL